MVSEKRYQSEERKRNREGDIVKRWIGTLVKKRRDVISYDSLSFGIFLQMQYPYKISVSVANYLYNTGTTDKRDAEFSVTMFECG